MKRQGHYRQEEINAKIKSSHLLKRLQAFALNEKIKGANGSEAEEVPEMNALQVKAIEILLKKTVPDLSSHTLKGGDEDDNPVSIAVEFIGPLTLEGEFEDE